MTLGDHLQELRSRLLKCVIAVGALGIASLVFAKPIFGLLMQPVLTALPPDQRSLIYTSGIEELNVLMKVGLYCGIFLSTPVILWQLWGFVAPGLYKEERRLAGPFILLGTLAFIVGASFCYLVLLPTMFEFLLQEPDVAELRGKVERSKLAEEDVLRWVRMGEFEEAGALAQKALPDLDRAPAAAVVGTAGAPDPDLELKARLEALGRLVDAATVNASEPSRAVIKQVMALRMEAVAAFAEDRMEAAAGKMEEAAGRLAGISPEDAAPFASVWRLEKAVAARKNQLDAENWTRPMLTMSEQLTLVLILELALGVIFELPLVMALLALAGIVRSKWLFKYQRHAMVVCLFLAAVITPTGDAINLALLAGPMMLCYELGVVAVWLIERRRKNRTTDEALALR